MKRIFILSAILFANCIAFAQTGLTTLNLPTNGPRYDDIFFINDTVGWVISGRDVTNTARIYHTTNGGYIWTEQFTTNKYLRSMEFATDKIGFCGSLDSTLFKTIDGGLTWTDISTSIPIRPKGICGLSIPDPSTIYGVGKYSGNACLIKSADGGNTWTYTDMTAYAKGLVDVYFFNKLEGFVGGISSTDGGVLLYTNDGGITWSYKFKTTVIGDYIWKIQTPDNINLFASIDAPPSSGNTRFLYSRDRGVTWYSKTWANTYNLIQGIGFITPEIGWTGGDKKLFKTIDGGNNWVVENFRAPAFDRFYKINDKVAFLSGQGVFRYDAPFHGNPGNPGNPGTPSSDIHTLTVTPNPSRRQLKIVADFPYNTYAIITIYGSDGKVIAQLLDADVTKGSKTIDHDLSKNAAGIYYVVLRTNEGMIYKKIIKQ